MKLNPTTSAASVLEFMKAGLPPTSIADRLGLSLVQTRLLIKEHDPSYKPSQQKDMLAVGLSQDSVRLRVRLSGLLYDLYGHLCYDKVKLSQATGLNRFEILRAMRRPYTHNWTLSQQERLCQALDIRFDPLRLLLPSEYARQSEFDEFDKIVSEVEETKKLNSRWRKP